MFLHLACLPLVAVLINDVRSESSGDVLTVDVATSEPVARADVRGVSGGSRRMFVYVQGTSASRKSFGSGPEAIVVHPRARYTKLEIPTDGRCAEPMSVESTSAGVRVRAICRGSRTIAAMIPPPVRLPGKAETEEPSPDAPSAALGRGRARADSLRAVLSLPAGASDSEKEADGTAVDSAGQKGSGGDATGTATGPAPANAGPLAAASAKAAPLAPTTQPDAPIAAVASTESSGPSSSGNSGSQGKPTSGAPSVLLAVALLAGLGVAAVLFARRRSTRVRMIRIVETASIGPRRSLVVACIGGRTMVLGVSEAGVSLLDAQAGPPGVPAMPERGQPSNFEEAALGLRGMVTNHTEARADAADDARHEGSLLGRLFQRGTTPSESARRGHEFDQLLAESLEDQELRRKLSLGEAGRVA